MTRKAPAVAAFVLGFVAACRPAPERRAIEVVPVVSRPNGRLCEQARIVVRTGARWETLWTQIQGEVTRSPAPAVDFHRDMLLAVASGPRSSGGHSIAVEKVKEEGEKLVADVVETSPGPRCMTTQALTCPVAVVRTAARGETVEFRTRSAVNDCAR